MSRRSLTHAAQLALVVSVTTSLAQAQTTSPASPLPATSPAAPSVAMGPELSQVTENLDAKLEAMKGTPSGLTADEVARRTLISNPDVTAKQKSVDAADA